jgi:hypothetical protein
MTMLQRPMDRRHVVRHLIPLSALVSLEVLELAEGILVLLLVRGEGWLHLETAGEC